MIVCKGLGITLRAKGPNPEISSVSVRFSIGGMPAVKLPTIAFAAIFGKCISPSCV